MSVAERIEELNDGLLAAYASVGTKGGTVPSEKNLDNLPTAIESISGGGAEGDPYITFSTDSGTNSLTTSRIKDDNLNLEYSYDTTTWTRWDLTTPLEFGGATKLYLRGTNMALGAPASYFTVFSFSSNTPLVDCTGKLTRLLSYQGDFDVVCPSQYCFYLLFNGCKALRTAPELPCKYLQPSCYYGMFQGCTSLTTAPELPATTLVSECYDSMFNGCTSLTTAPELPATTLAYRCYGSMFYDCSSLTTAPELPATTLANKCYQGMFGYCTSLTTAPELPATTLATYCYATMFNGCRSLTATPELPATTLASNCYYGMFQNCTYLTTAPELPATTLATYCYATMFNSCSRISYIKCLATDISASYALSGWVGGAPSTGTFVKAAGVTWPSGTDGIPNGWTVEEV